MPPKRCCPIDRPESTLFVVGTSFRRARSLLFGAADFGGTGVPGAGAIHCDERDAVRGRDSVGQQ
jgi:hypothetical protein